MRRDTLLDAAEALLTEWGSNGLTLSAVAERAGVSKGGLLYHFASKEALINGMIERLIAEFDALVEAQRQDTYSNTYTKAYMEATIAAIRGGRLRRWAVVTGATGDPRLLAPIRQAMVRWHTEGLDAEPDPEASRIVRLACEGLWEVATHCPDLPIDYDRLRQRLLDLL